MQLRPATIDDADYILEIRNDETTRENSFNSGIISRNEHIKWYEKKLTDNNCIMFILEDNNESVGTIRLDLVGSNQNVGEISYMIGPDKRGHGYGSAALKLLEEKLPETVKTLVGFVLEANVASSKCFKKNGYVELTVQDSKCYIKAL